MSGVAELFAYHLATNIHVRRRFTGLEPITALVTWQRGPVWKRPKGSLLTTQAFVAVLHIKTTDAARPTVSPIRLLAATSIFPNGGRGADVRV
jgi:hypothetical protein